MDPNANLNAQRTIIQRLNALRDAGDDDNNTAAALGFRLAELIEALDQWIVAGGFLPDPWAGRK